jgi:MFS family permease
MGGVLAELGRQHRRPPVLFGLVHVDEFSVPFMFIFLLALLNAALLILVFDDNDSDSDNGDENDSNEKENTSREKGNQNRGRVGERNNMRYCPWDGGTGMEGSSTSSAAAVGGVPASGVPSHSLAMAMSVCGCLLNLSTKGTIGVYETMGSTVARDVLGWHTERIGYTFTCFGILGTCSLLCFRLFYRYCDDLQLLLIGLAVMMVANTLMHNADTSLTDGRFTLAIGLMYSLGYPVGHCALLGGFAKITKRGPQGLVLGLFASAGSVARVVFPVLAGVLAETYNDSDIFIFMTVLLALSFSLAYIYRRQIRAVIDS